VALTVAAEDRWEQSHGVRSALGLGHCLIQPTVEHVERLRQRWYQNVPVDSAEMLARTPELVDRVSQLWLEPSHFVEANAASINREMLRISTRGQPRTGVADIGAETRDVTRGADVLSEDRDDEPE
jgi:hypothetical protein